MNNLVSLFNVGFDYAIRRKLTEPFVGVHKRERATHRLTCTKWNVPPGEDENKRKSLREEHVWRRRRNDYALCVLAVPLHRRKEPKVLSQKLKAPIASPAVFDRSGTLDGQRAVLSAMVATHKTPTAMRRLIKRMGKDKCYRLYRTLRKASNRAARLAKRLARRQARKAA